MDFNSADLVWAGLLTIGGAFEVYAIKNKQPGDTLSEATRRWFRVNTRAGRWVFGIAWSAFAIWFGLHVLGLEGF